MASDFNTYVAPAIGDGVTICKMEADPYVDIKPNIDAINDALQSPSAPSIDTKPFTIAHDPAITPSTSSSPSVSYICPTCLLEMDSGSGMKLHWQECQKWFERWGARGNGEYMRTGMKPDAERHPIAPSTSAAHRRRFVQSRATMPFLKPEQQTSEIGRSARSVTNRLILIRRKVVLASVDDDPIDVVDEPDATLPIRVNHQHVVRPHNQRKSMHTVDRRSPSPRPIVVEARRSVIKKPRKVPKNRDRTNEYERRRIKRRERWAREAKELARETREQAVSSPPQSIGAEKHRQSPPCPFKKKRRTVPKRRDRTKEYDRRNEKRRERWARETKAVALAKELVRETTEAEEETCRWMTEELLAAREDSDEED